MFRPSVDRIVDSLGYSIANIQLMTWGENKSKGYHEQKLGIGKLGNCKSVIYIPTGEVFASIAIAHKEKCVGKTTIYRHLKGDAMTIDKQWRYK